MSAIRSIISPLPAQSTTCGYCSPPGRRSTEKTNCHAAECIPLQLSCEDYQQMIDRGWRRSGTYCYKPDLKRSCCPQYTIKLDALQFKESKSQRKLVNRFNRWVLYCDNQAGADIKQKGRENSPAPIAEAIHAAEYERSTAGGNFEPAHRFEVTIEPSSFTDEKFALYQIYQREIHKETEDKRPTSFKGFLVENNLVTEDIPYPEPPPSHLPCKYGAYHQMYRLDGELVAVGVIDILPNCVSSVYFMYNNKWERFSLGKLSALRELSLAKEIHDAGITGMQYLYMGFYVYTCKKMRYKGEYSPSFLADPEEYSWHPLAECNPSLERYRYATFAHPEHSIEGAYDGPDHDPRVSDLDLQDIRVVISINNGVATVDSVKATTEWKMSLVRRAVLSTVDGLGLSLAKRILLYFAHL